MIKIKTFLAFQIVFIYIAVSIFIIIKNPEVKVVPEKSVIDFTKPVTSPVTTPVVTTPVTTTPTPAKASGFTLAQVLLHNTSSNCWSTVNGKVYDLTSWIGQHPGGSGAIKEMCGIDASSMYNDQHGNQRRPANELSGFLIGNLI